MIFETGNQQQRPPVLVGGVDPGLGCMTKLATAWNKGLAGDGMVHFSYSALDSLLAQRLPNPCETPFRQRNGLV